MYGGRCEFVRIRFTNDLLDTVVDRFGRYASFSEDDSRAFHCIVEGRGQPHVFRLALRFWKESDAIVTLFGYQGIHETPCQDARTVPIRKARRKSLSLFHFNAATGLKF